MFDSGNGAVFFDETFTSLIKSGTCSTFITFACFYSYWLISFNNKDSNPKTERPLILYSYLHELTSCWFASNEFRPTMLLAWVQLACNDSPDFCSFTYQIWNLRRGPVANCIFIFFTPLLSPDVAQHSAKTPKARSEKRNHFIAICPGICFLSQMERGRFVCTFRCRLVFCFLLRF